MYGGDIGPAWEASQQGYRLAHATAAKPIQRATAERLLAEVVARAEVLRDVARHSYAFTVARLVVFGSFLTDVPTLGDLDISVAWAPRLPERNAQYTYTRERIALARREWRQFSNMSEEFAWPHVEVARFLRGRSRAVSLHDHDEEPDFIAGIPHRVLL